MTDQVKRGCAEAEERFTPYVDGEAPAQERQAVEVHIGKCPPCRAHLASEQSARELLHAHRDALKAQAPATLHARCAARGDASSTRAARWAERGRRWVPLSVAATLLLVLGGVVLLSPNNRAQALAAELTLDHLKCFRLHMDPSAHPDAVRAGETWAAEQGWSLSIPASDPSGQLRLLTVRRCLSTDGRAAHLMYLWRGEPLSVYVLPRIASRDTLVQTLGHEAVIWTSEGRTYAVLTRGHPSDLATVVSYVKAHAR